jgi:eukaryotic-like serine/threonine-protein kinase
LADVRERLDAALADRYRVVRELGSGAMSTVFLAEDLKRLEYGTDSRREALRTVAIKVFRPDVAAALGTQRFLREIEITSGLTHPHILPLYDWGVAGDLLHYVTPHVEGATLRDRIDREKLLPVEEALRIAAEVAGALEFAHAKGVVHRDIKPENVLLSGGEAVVADFGIARAIEVAGGTTLTEAGVIIGTPAYMSPEQAGGGGSVDERSDLYSLACVLYEMLAGEPPYTGPTTTSILGQHLAAPVPDVGAMRATVPPAVRALLTRAMSKAPVDRFQNAAAFRGRKPSIPSPLRPLGGAHGSTRSRATTRPPPPPPERPSRWSRSFHPATSSSG